MTLLIVLLQIFTFVLFVRVILSWVRPSPGGTGYQAVELVERVTEPVLGPIRRVLPSFGGIDLSPLVVILGIRIILIPLLRGL